MVALVALVSATVALGWVVFVLLAAVFDLGVVAVALAVFAAAAALDFAAARYTRALIARRWNLASLWSVAMCLLSAVALLALVDVSRWMLVPECCGLVAGTQLAGMLGSSET